MNHLEQWVGYLERMDDQRMPKKILMAQVIKTERGIDVLDDVVDNLRIMDGGVILRWQWVRDIGEDWCQNQGSHWVAVLKKKKKCIPWVYKSFVTLGDGAVSSLFTKPSHFLSECILILKTVTT